MAEATERLLLQVDAATELLRRHLAEGEQPLERFERRAERMAAKVDQSIGDMGKRFGNFAQLAENAATRAERSFEASFSQVQRIAAQAIKGPTIDGRIDLGADDIRAGAAAAQQQARAFGLIGDAAERAAASVGDTSEATRLFIQATNASRVEAERKAAALLAEAGALERVEAELLQSAEATELFVSGHQRLAQAAEQQRQLALTTAQTAAEERGLAAAAALLRSELDPMYAAQQRFDVEMERAERLLAAGAISAREYAAAQQLARGNLASHAQAVAGSAAVTGLLVDQQQRATRSTGAQRAAMQGLSYQAQDVFTQLSMNANLFQVIAIQGGQAAGQFANLEGKAGSFARFMIGPYGLAITAALLVTGALTKDLDLFGNELDEAVEKLRKDAAEAETAARAKAVFGATVDGVSAAIKEQNEALGRSIQTQRQAAQAALDAANAQAAAAQKVRERTVAELNLAKALSAKARTASGTVGGGGEFGGMAGAFAQAAIDRDEKRLEAQLKKAEENVRKGNTGVRLATIPLARMQAEAAVTPTGGADRRYEDQRTRIERQFLRDGNRAAYEAALGKATRAHADEVEAINEANRKRRGPSAETLARRAEAARQKVLSDDISFADDERAARRRLIDAQQRSAGSEEERDRLTRDEINAEIDGLNKKVRLQQEQGKRSAAEADQIVALNEGTRAQRLRNIEIERGVRTVQRRFDAEEAELQSRLQLLRLNEGLAGTERDRRAVAQQILEIEQQLRRKALERLRDTSTDPAQVQRARDELGRLPTIEAAEQRQADRGSESPLDQYRRRLLSETADTGDALEEAAVRGFGALEDEGARATASAITNLLRLRGVAGDVIGGVIADLARLAVQKAVVSAIGGGFFGLAGGGAIADLPGFAEGGTPGGKIQGPGNGTSDSILALLAGGKGAIRVSTGEFIVNEAATRENLPLLHAINARRLPRFADGGSIADLRMPSLPRAAGGAPATGGQLMVRLALTDDLSARIDNRAAGVAVEVVRASAPELVETSRLATLASLAQPTL